MSTNRRSLVFGTGLLAIAFLIFAPTAQAVCGPVTTYSLSTGAPPTVNWTDPSAWTPTGVPGSGTCDAVTSGLSRTVVVDTVIPNPLVGLLLNCSGCAIDIRSGGQLTVSGPGNLRTAAIVKVNGGTLVVNTAAGDGGLTFEAGTQLHLLSGTIAGSGTINISPNASLLYDSSSSATLDGVTIKNDGAILLSPSASPTLTLTNGAFVDNWAAIEILDSLEIASGSGANRIENNDMFVVASGVTAGVDVALDHEGSTVEVGSGATLMLRGGGTGGAPFSIDNGGTLDFPSGSYTMLAGGSVDGPGTLAVSGGSLEIGGVTEPDHFRLSAGTLTGNGFLSIGKGFDWSGGTITGTGGSELQGNGFGTISGADGPMVLDGRTFNNYGSISYTATTQSLMLQNGATLGTYGTFDVQVDGAITCGCALPPLIKVAPNGVLMKSGGSGIFSIQAPLENTATIYSFSGTLQFTAGGTHTGGFYAFGGGKVQWAGGSTTFQPFSNISGDGQIEFFSGSAVIGGTYDVTGQTELTGASVTVNSAATTNDLLFDGSTLHLADDFTMTGEGSWSSGTIDGAGGSFVVASGATLTIDGSSGVTKLQQVELINDGTIAYVTADGSSSYLTFTNSFLTNNATFDIQTDAPIVRDEDSSSMIVAHGGSTDPSIFTNLGTLKKTAAGGTTAFEPILDNAGDLLAQSGTLHVVQSFTQTAGATVLGPGSITTPQLRLDGGVLRGSGTLDGNVENDAEVAPGSSTVDGAITITGDYTQLSGGTLSVKLLSSSQYDQLIVNGTASIDGTLDATLIGGYQPADGTTFPVFTYASYGGAFTTENLPSYGSSGTITSNYTTTAYELVAHVAPASADLRLQMSGPTTVNAGDPLAYTLTVDNLGTDATTGTISVANTLPAGVTGASGSGSGWICSAPSAGVITCTASASLAMSQALPPLTIAMTAPTNARSEEHTLNSSHIL